MNLAPASRLLAAVAVLLAIAVSPARGQEAKLYFPACEPYAESYVFDCYHDYDEVSRFVQAAAEVNPELARLESIGQSYEGRELWLMTITDFSTGNPEDKPAIWVDGGVDSDEVVSIEAALGVIHRLLNSDDPEIAALLARNTFYVAPTVMPDATHRHYTTPVRPRDTTLRPWDDDNDGLFDEDPPDDLDGDGMALRMRQVDPQGDWVKDERDGRSMRQRRPEDEGPFYTLYAEGLDDDGDGRYAEDMFGGVDPNRNYPGNWSITQGGSGPFPASEPGVRALLEFALDHPNIAASQHFHSSGGVVLRPPSVPELTLPRSDEALYLEMSRLGLEATGYDLATTVYDWNWPRGSSNRKPTQVWRDAEGEVQMRDGLVAAPREGAGVFGGLRSDSAPAASYPAYGGSIDGMYLLFGVLAFANEIYPMGEDLDGDGRLDEIEQLQYNDEAMDGYAFKDWEPFEHPQLGPVEIGGWRKFGHNNPPPDELHAEVERNVEFVLLQVRHMPRLAVRAPEIESLGGGVYRVTAAVDNLGFQPTELAIRVNQNRAIPVRARIDGAEILSERAVHELGVIGGYDSAETTWLVRADSGTAISVSAWHPKAGRVLADATLRDDE